MGKYYCWGPDQEDLTAQVVIKVGASHVMRTEVLRFVSSGTKPAVTGDWKVTDIFCTQGHKNTFEGSGEP